MGTFVWSQTAEYFYWIPTVTLTFYISNFKISNQLYSIIISRGTQLGQEGQQKPSIMTNLDYEMQSMRIYGRTHYSLPRQN